MVAEAGDGSAAVARAREVVAAAPDAPAALAALGHALADSGEPGEAIDVLRRTTRPNVRQRALRLRDQRLSQLRAGERETTSYLTTAGEAVLGPTKGFTTFDFSVGTQLRNWTLSAYVQNAFDKRGILSKNGQCAPTICGQYARLYPTKPQLFGVRLGAKF